MPGAEPLADLIDPTLYRNPTSNCDVVMKGGITSGVVYPPALCELARRYRFKNIGGTSAGAIAASFAAAAELGRESDAPGAGFAGLATVAQSLQQPEALSGLFQPQPSMRLLFRVLKGCVAGQGPRYLGVSGAILLAALGDLYWRFGRGWHEIVLVLLAGWLVTVAVLALTVWSSLPVNRYGLCTGLGPGTAGGPPLSVWLTQTINRLAGQPVDGAPLTFGDLWQLHDRSKARFMLRRGLLSDGQPWRPVDYRIRLELITTCVSHGQPYLLPFASDDFCFNCADMQAYFPPAVVKWMVEKSAGVVKTGCPRECLHQLPAAADFPVVVATRLSLSVPPLMSMVPLYHARAQEQYRRAWFTDGGVCSNFPMQLFDTFLPRWPTFGINLLPAQDDKKPRVFIANHDSDLPFETERIRGVSDFGGALIDIARNWSDTMLSHQPGCRERIVNIELTQSEGGFNLDMPQAVIAALLQRGRLAGQTLLNQFQWDNHRWIRYRVVMTQLEERMLETHESWTEPANHNFGQFAASPPPGVDYPDLAPEALTRVVDLIDLIGTWRNRAIFAQGSPGADTQLRIVSLV